MTYKEMVMKLLHKEVIKYDSMRKAAKAFGVDPSYLSRLVDGTHVPRLSTLRKMFPDLKDELDELAKHYTPTNDPNTVETAIVIRCTDLDSARRALERIGYKLEINIVKIGDA